eukprot:TRINITY_DN18503_c0_g1::TRINITY_DN18503_c0_g1_i1::g.2828::m.2828 TRINITY_DN18503_c0_g1::TRINITY_DN18503_c0_g1_i1::g.2828  ORF type:complete len:205 (+),score=27.15,sp/Q9LNQ1/TI231_ARATH/34.75/2e-13,Tim17/PF02466.14/3.7e+03,Tim17/PF02466.14/1e-14,Gly-zipper_OmpA/PF13436.1/41,Gly-zipper_OmpA/PF13436.1/0.43 TRINITY_DN18503_c0_g1_i1:66-680(+)
MSWKDQDTHTDDYRPEDIYSESPSSSSGKSAAARLTEMDTSRVASVLGSVYGSSQGVYDDYIFGAPTAEKPKTWGEELTFYTGVSAMTGALAGTSLGFVRGLSSSQGYPRKLRVNAILNSVTRHSSKIGNGVGCWGLMFAVLDSATYNVYQDNEYVNAGAAGSIATALMRSPLGVRQAGIGGAVGAVAGVGFKYIMQQIELLMS